METSNNQSASRDVIAKDTPLLERKKKRGLTIEGYPVEGLSIGGHETCVIFPSFKLAFDIGRCPQQAIAQDFLFISHGHMDHIVSVSWSPGYLCRSAQGGLPFYVATRGLYSMQPPTVFIPSCLKENVEKLFEVHRSMDQSSLEHKLITLDVGQEFQLRRDLKVRAFKTCHVIPSQITNTVTTPEIAFTGDTTSDFIVDDANLDVLRAKILVMECTFVDASVTPEHARKYGHTHLSEITNYAHMFKNKAILLIHFSARYRVEAIEEAVSALPPPLAGRVFSLTEGFGNYVHVVSNK